MASCECRKSPLILLLFIGNLCLAGAAGPISDAMTWATAHTPGAAKAMQSQHFLPSNPRLSHMTAAIWRRLQDQSQPQCMGTAQQSTIPQDGSQQGQYHLPAQSYLNTTSVSPPAQPLSDLQLPHQQATHDCQKSNGSIPHEASQDDGTGQTLQRRHSPGMLRQQISSVQYDQSSSSHSRRSFHSSSWPLTWPQQQGISHGLIPRRSNSSSSSSSNGPEEAAVEAASPTPAPTAPQQASGTVQGPLAVQSVLSPQQVYEKVRVPPKPNFAK